MITIESNPPLYPSIHDALWYVTSSNNISNLSFKYVFDVYVNGALVSRTKVFPEPVSNYGVFNASPIARAFVGNYFKPQNTFLSFSNNEIGLSYQIKIGEEYISGGNLVTNLNLVTISATAYNYYPPLFADSLVVMNNNSLAISDYQDGLLIENFTDDFLSERKIQDITMEFSDSLFISYLKITSGTYTANIEVLEDEDTVIADHSASVTLNMLSCFNLQPALINAWAGSNIINENTYGYNFYISKGDATSRVVKVRLVCNPKHRQFNLHFLNRLGGFDTMRFGLVNKRTQSVQKTNYVKSAWQLSGNKMSKTDAYNRINESNVNFAITHKNTYHLVSDWVSEQDYEWLAQLVASPIVYLEFNGAYFPVNITNDSHEFKTESADKLFNFELDIEINNYITSQFR